jgi:hypothetical protein
MESVVMVVEAVGIELGGKAPDFVPCPLLVM